MKYLKQFNESINNLDIIELAGNGDIKGVKRLIEAGSNLDIQNELGETALIYSSFCGHIDIVKLLIGAGVDLDIQDNYERTALISASVFNHEKVVKLLLDNFADEYVVDTSGKSFYDYLSPYNKKYIEELHPMAVANAKLASGN